MGFAAGRFLGVPARVQRVSFTGEMSFEINVPAVHCQDIIEAVMKSGGDRIEPIGVEALMVLRAEKGYLHVGGDTDGTTNPLDLGFAGIVAKKQSDFVGKRSLLRDWDQRTDRRQLVGIEPLNPNENLEPGAHFITSEETGFRSQGMVTSAVFSPTLNRSIGLGLLERGFERMGEQVRVFDNGRSFDVRITGPVFYDPQGEKMNA
jgi:sarcosine oxidase subunit alpha